MKFLAVLGREPVISLAELEALFSDVRQISSNLATFESNKLEYDSSSTRSFEPVVTGLSRSIRSPLVANGLERTYSNFINRLGGSLKLAVLLDAKPLEYLSNLPDGKITLGVSDYSRKATKKSAISEALKLKQILSRHGRSMRVVPSDGATLSTATSLHNGLSGKNAKKVELIKVENDWYKVIGVQDIDAYSRRDQGRPARDAKVGMLPPKLAQILINLCGPLPPGSRILDPFCGTGVVLQEALLMGYSAYGTDLSDRMVEYSKRNLEWFIKTSNMFFSETEPSSPSLRVSGSSSVAVAPASRAVVTCGCSSKNIFEVSTGDATNFTWAQPIDAVACEGYLGQPMSQPPADIKLKQEKQTCQEIVLGFLKNLSHQIKSGTPVVIAIPAWLRPDGSYSRLEILDLLPDMGYNVNNKSREGLLYHREGQIVARDIIILRKK